MLQIRNLGEIFAKDRGLRSARESDPFVIKKSKRTEPLEILKISRPARRRSFMRGGVVKRE
jgi:hypothetical protein